MAIALDTTSGSASNVTSSPVTWSHTCTGSNLILFVGITLATAGSPVISIPTYNGVAMTLVDSQRAFGNGKGALYMLVGPSTGANTISIAFSGTTANIAARAASYTGAAQSGQPDASTGKAVTAANGSVAVTTIADNSWVIGTFSMLTFTPTAGLTSRGTMTANTGHGSLEDNNAAKTPAGSVTVNWTNTSGAYGISAASFAPFIVVTAALTGTVTASISETDIVAGGKTIILTLTGDTWIAAGALNFDLQRQNIINGLTSGGSESLGWNNVVKALQGVAGVVRTSNTVVTITLDAQVTYNITSSETITATIPATAVAGGNAVVASPTFTVSATAGTVIRQPLLLGVG